MFLKSFQCISMFFLSCFHTTFRSKNYKIQNIFKPSAHNIPHVLVLSNVPSTFNITIPSLFQEKKIMFNLTPLTFQTCFSTPHYGSLSFCFSSLAFLSFCHSPFFFIIDIVHICFCCLPNVGHPWMKMAHQIWIFTKGVRIW